MTVLLSDILVPFDGDLLFDFFYQFYPAIWLLSSGLGIAAYVLSSLSLYSIAEKRNIKNPWLAWLPIGANWILGSISDQYQYVVKGKKKSKRKLLLFCEILFVAVLIAFFVLFIMGIISFEPLPPENFSPETDSPYEFLYLLVGLLAIWLVVEVFSIVLMVVRFMALFDLYRSCNPATAEVFLVFSILAGWIPCGALLEPIFMFLNRKKELGMPPRKTAQPEVSYETFAEDTADE